MKEFGKKLVFGLTGAAMSLATLGTVSQAATLNNDYAQLEPKGKNVIEQTHQGNTQAWRGGAASGDIKVENPSNSGKYVGLKYTLADKNGDNPGSTPTLDKFKDDASAEMAAKAGLGGKVPSKAPETKKPEATGQTGVKGLESGSAAYSSVRVSRARSPGPGA